MRYIWLLRGMFDRNRWRRLVVLMFAIFVSGIVYLGYLCPDWICSSSARSPSSHHHQDFVSSRYPINPVFPSEDESPWNINTNLISPSDVNFSLEDLDRRYWIDGDHDILVFLHVQKTGGSTFGRHLVRDAVGIPVPCSCQPRKKRCDCVDVNGKHWLFSRYSTGWACGLHADWTELHDCVPQVLDDREGKKRQRRYLYFTVLRDPVQRYLSEWKHVQRGSTWQSAKLRCNGRQATLSEVPFCFKGSDWTGVTLDEFASCQHNLATNRQTRMLANLTLVGCYDRSVIPDPEERDRILLRSAMDNLRQMSFFGLTEFQAETRYLFERTFGFRFRRDFVQFNETHARRADVTEDQMRTVRLLNRLDIILYDYAKRLFAERLKRVRVLDTSGGVSDRSPNVARVTDGRTASGHETGYADNENYNGDDEMDEDEERTETKHYH